MPHPLQLTNTATGKLEPFTPIDASKVGFYSCGPTVYNAAHIGNLSTYVFNDLLKRALVFLGYGVKHVMNITDVDDKMITASQKRGIPMAQLADEYTKLFFEDCTRLNVLHPDITCPATHHLPQMLALIEKLIAKGAAYVRDGSVYFSIAAFPSYGQFAHLDPEALANSSRPTGAGDEAYEKDDVRDFALWKAWTADDGDVAWDSPWGRGRPGWHIECSAMSMHYLGESFDLHTGAIDLVFPHHQNEIAQSEAATGKPFVKTWLHRAFVTMGGEKMAKRVGNVVYLSDVTHSPDPDVAGLQALAFRLLVLSSHYRSEVRFTPDTTGMHEANLVRILELADALEHVSSKHGHRFTEVDRLIERTRTAFTEALADDLNTPVAFAAVFELVRIANGWLATDAIDASEARDLRGLLTELDAVLGFVEKGLPLYRAATAPTHHQLARLEELAALRTAKDFTAADALRAELIADGLDVQITKSGVTAKRRVFTPAPAAA